MRKRKKTPPNHPSGHQPSIAIPVVPAQATVTPETETPPKSENLEPPKDGASPSNERRSPIPGQIATIVAFSVLALILDWALTPMPWYRAYTLGGYALAQSRLAQDAKPNAVVVDLDALVPLRDRRSSPTKADDSEWRQVAEHWKTLGRTVTRLQENGARAIMVDWELALKDDYLGVNSFFDPTKIPVAAQNSYQSLLTTLLKVDRKCPVVIGADWINESANEQRRNDTKQWFPIAEAAKMAASLTPPSQRQGFDEVAYSIRGASGQLPPASEIMAQRLGDRLRDPVPLGFSPFAEEVGGEHGRPFWIDHSFVDSQAKKPDEVNGKIVVLASVSDMGDRTDAETVPDFGQRPGGFFHAAAIGTRVGRPLYSFANAGAENASIFVLNLCFGFLAMGLTLLIVKLKRLEHHTPNVYFIEFWMESLATVLAAGFLLWFVGAVSNTRLLLPGVSAVLAVRVLEPVFTLLRFRKLVTRWKEPEH